MSVEMSLDLIALRLSIRSENADHPVRSSAGSGNPLEVSGTNEELAMVKEENDRT
jgi:hypothetical protein